MSITSNFLSLVRQVDVKLPLWNRAHKMIVGSFLADASTMGLHWIYNQADINDKISSTLNALVYAGF